MISEDVRSKVAQVKGVEMAVINMVWEPPWTPERMSDDARRTLGIG
jgi:metal-sulfur cluster biosynthetic enzyme